jgi:Uma2 family endonuclease
MNALLETPPTLYLCPELAGTLMTPEEFDAVEDAEEGYRYELIHGVLVVSPPPLPAESDPNEELGHWLRTFWEQHPEAMDGTVHQHHIRTATGWRVIDRAIWIGLGRQPDRRQDTPTIAVEFVSGSRRDRLRDYVEKRQEYIAAGVAEYWIFDRFRRTLTVVRPGPNGPIDQVISETSTFTTPLLPGFELSLAPLLAVADRWAEKPE